MRIPEKYLSVTYVSPLPHLTEHPGSAPPLLNPAIIQPPLFPLLIRSKSLKSIDPPSPKTLSGRTLFPPPLYQEKNQGKYLQDVFSQVTF